MSATHTHEYTESSSSIFVHNSNEDIQLDGTAGNLESSNILTILDELKQRLNRISIEELVFTKSLEDWRLDAHTIVDEFYHKIRDKYINHTKQEINDLLLLITGMINHDNETEEYLDWAKQTITSIERNLEQVKQTQCQLHRLEIDGSTISFPSLMNNFEIHESLQSDDIRSPSFQKSDNNSLSRSSLSNDSNITPTESSSYCLTLSPQESFYPYIQSPVKTIDLTSDNWFTLATNENHTLAIGKSVMYLFDEHLKLIRQRSCSHPGVKDICWSRTLDKFICISPREIFTVDENTLTLNPYDLNFNSHSVWERGTCADTTLLLSTFGQYPFIAEFHLHSNIQFHRRYQSEIIANESETINDIEYHNNKLAIVIEDALTNQTYLELRTLKPFECIWTILLGEGWGYRCTCFYNRYWVVIDSYNDQCIYVLHDGTVSRTEHYSLKPMSIAVLNKYRIVVRTKQTLNVYECE